MNTIANQGYPNPYHNQESSDRVALFALILVIFILMVVCGLKRINAKN